MAQDKSMFMVLCNSCGHETPKVLAERNAWRCTNCPDNTGKIDGREGWTPTCMATIVMERIHSKRIMKKGVV
jgi:hypothetical protein